MIDTVATCPARARAKSIRLCQPLPGPGASSVAPTVRPWVGGVVAAPASGDIRRLLFGPRPDFTHRDLPTAKSGRKPLHGRALLADRCSERGVLDVVAERRDCENARRRTRVGVPTRPSFSDTATAFRSIARWAGRPGQPSRSLLRRDSAALSIAMAPSKSCLGTRYAVGNATADIRISTPEHATTPRAIVAGRGDPRHAATASTTAPMPRPTNNAAAAERKKKNRGRNG